MASTIAAQAAVILAKVRVGRSIRLARSKFFKHLGDIAGRVAFPAGAGAVAPTL